MHYMIVIWDQESVQYRIMHYTHDYNDMQNMMKKYPEASGYIHMIDVRFIKGHDFLEKYKKMREEQQAV